MEQCVVDGEDQVGHHLPQQDGTLVILPVAETHGDQCAEPDELVKYVHPSFLLIKTPHTLSDAWRKMEAMLQKIHTYFGVLLYHGTAAFVNCGKRQPPKAMGFWSECSCPQVLLYLRSTVCSRGPRTFLLKIVANLLHRSCILPQFLGHGGNAFHNNVSLHRLPKHFCQATLHGVPIFSEVVQKPKRLADALV